LARTAANENEEEDIEKIGNNSWVPYSDWASQQPMRKKEKTYSRDDRS
jgi:hypothetical protein